MIGNAIESPRGEIQRYDESPKERFDNNFAELQIKNDPENVILKTTDNEEV